VNYKPKKGYQEHYPLKPAYLPKRRPRETKTGREYTSTGRSEETAYEAQQLAQSRIRKKINAGRPLDACDLAYSGCLTILQKGRVSLASQLLTLLVEVLRETQTIGMPEWLDRLATLQEAHSNAMDDKDNANLMTGPEASRLNRLQRDWLRATVQWSADISTIKYGANRLHELLGQQCWKVSLMPVTETMDVDDVLDFKCDAVIHMSLAKSQTLSLNEHLARTH
jgi:hypothetical protein